RYAAVRRSAPAAELRNPAATQGSRDPAAACIGRNVDAAVSGAAHSALARLATAAPRNAATGHRLAARCLLIMAPAPRPALGDRRVDRLEAARGMVSVLEQRPLQRLMCDSQAQLLVTEQPGDCGGQRTRVTDRHSGRRVRRPLRDMS